MAGTGRTGLPYEIYIKGICEADDYHAYGGLGGYCIMVVHNSKLLYSKVEMVLRHTTVFEVEIKAAVEALEYIDKNKNIFEDAILYTDNETILQCYFKEWWKKWQNNAWRTSKDEPVKCRSFWWRLVPFFEKRTYTITTAQNKDGNLYYRMCVERATDTAALARYEYYKKIREEIHDVT